MMRIGIIGAGHAGMEAAKTAIKAGASVVVFSAEESLPYFRPRLVALAFKQVEEARILLNPAAWYVTNKVELRLTAKVESIDPAGPAVVVGGVREVFDALVLATGAGPVVPPFARGHDECLIPLWNIKNAHVIAAKIGGGKRLAIIGGGVIGVEAALRAVDAGMSVVVIEKMERLMQTNLGPRAGALLRQRLEDKGIKVLTGVAVSGAKCVDSRLVISLATGDPVEVDVGILSVGYSRDLCLARNAGLEVGIGVRVDSRMCTSVSKIFACGDIADTGGARGCSVPQALSQGRAAGANACAVVSGAALIESAPVFPSIVLKHGTFELRSVGAVTEANAEERLLEGSDALNVRVQVVRNGVAAGVHMVGNCVGFDEYAKQIGSSVS